MTEFETDQLRRAYQLLDVRYSASEGSIKRAYRRVTKRWHPDRYANGTPAHAEATQMMKLINEAYAQIEDAPLRYYTEHAAVVERQTDFAAPDPGVHNPSAENPYVQEADATDIETRSARLGQRIGLCFRFVAGGVLGVYVLWVFYILLRLAGHPVPAIVLAIGAFLGGGFAMTHYGQNVRWGRW